MGHSVTLGGERVGSGKKNKVYLHNYERSTHNLSYDWLSTMGCGMLIPFMCELVTRDDKYEINLDAGLRTIPTKGPLFGSFKLQLDVYQCPLRLYQALLHNNPLALGLKASQVKFPKMRLYGECGDAETEYKENVSATNSLVKYLGISGIGTAKANNDGYINRDIFASHVLAYYDIFKNYYANKQEENAYTLSTKEEKTDKAFKPIYNETRIVIGNIASSVVWDDITQANQDYYLYENPDFQTDNYTMHFKFDYERITDREEKLHATNLKNTKVYLAYLDANEENEKVYHITIEEANEKGLLQGWNIDPNTNKFTLFAISRITDNGTFKYLSRFGIDKDIYLYDNQTILNEFQLKNIDDMRYKVLSFHQLGQSFLLDEENESIPQPYYEAVGGLDPNDQNWKKPLQGICVKTYQSDIFNNWLNTELIDGENGIAEITAISTTEGSITIDQIQFSEKLYNLLNRIAVSGGTYQDYLDAAYTESAKRFEESPIWIGGMSDEVIFEEIVQTAPTADSELGTLGGRGNLMGEKKGGRIVVKIDEPSLIIGIVSITPRIVQTQGNMWFNTEIDSLADIHVPALDGIGFQNLMAEQMDARAIIYDDNGNMQERAIVGKIPAWLNYMTNFDRAYGDFANTEGDGYMVLNRNYETKNGILQDATTYIDPAKYNYAFAYTKRDAQNFWVKIRCDIKARRLMSAKQIPTA